MGRVNHVLRLPKSVKDAINQKLSENWTLDQIIAHLRGLGVGDISRTGLHRYQQSHKEISDRLTATRAAATALARDLGAIETDDVSRLLLELLQNILYAASASAVGDNETVKPADIRNLTQALDHLAKARRNTIDIERRARVAIVKQIQEIVADTGKKQGLDDEVKAAIEAAIAGVPVP